MSIKFLGCSFGSLLELLEDSLELEKDIKEGQRKTKDDKGALAILSQTIRLCMGEKTMLRRQMDRMEEMAGDQGLLTQNQRIAKAMEENHRREKEFDLWLSKQNKKN